MERFELDRYTVDYMYRLYKSGRLNLEPPYQRTRVWSDDMRYDLIDSITQEFPIGLIMLNVVPHVDEDGTKIDKYDVVDGQQRMRTIIEYIDGAKWAESLREGFESFTTLKISVQRKYFDYKVPVASMKEFEPEEIIESYNRLQKGKALKIGEKLKSKTNSAFYRYLKDITSHRLFTVPYEKHKVRDSHWTLAASFFKSIYRNDLFGRQEYRAGLKNT